MRRRSGWRKGGKDPEGGKKWRGSQVQGYRTRMGGDEGGIGVVGNIGGTPGGR